MSGIILPELIVAAAGVVVMLYDSFLPKQRTVSRAIISLVGHRHLGGRARL